MDDFLREKYVILSVMGPHAGETPEQIFSRKKTDIKTTGRTFWVIQSHKANPTKACNLYHQAKGEGKEVYCIFIEPSVKGGARPTSISKTATSFSRNKINWESFSRNMSPVTGKIGNNSYALVFDELQIIKEPIILNLWNYTEFETDQPIVPKLGTSTICAVTKDMSNHPDRIKTNIRKVTAMAKLSELSCVWIR